MLHAFINQTLMIYIYCHALIIFPQRGTGSGKGWTGVRKGSPAGKGLTSWLSFVVSTVRLSLSHRYPGSGVVIDCINSWSLHPYLLRIFGMGCKESNQTKRIFGNLASDFLEFSVKMINSLTKFLYGCSSHKVYLNSGWKWFLLV